MATPLSYSKFIAALKAEGLKVVEHKTDGKSPQYHNRNSKGKWGPVHGTLLHHTVTKGHDRTIEICRLGHSTLPGPLCHGVICKKGEVHVVGYGRANHAGLGDDDVLDAVIADKPVPPDNEANTDGNARFYGFECENEGDNVDPWPEYQIEAMVRASAAMCRAHSWNVKGEGSEAVIAHAEWQPGKVDPRGPGYPGHDAIRDRVEERLQHEASWSPGDATTPPKPETPPTKPPVEPKPKYQPFPGADWFRKNPNSPIVTAMGKRLVAEGCGKYLSGPGPQWTDADRESYRRWQQKCGFTGRKAADGWPGEVSWNRLKVLFVK